MEIKEGEMKKVTKGLVTGVLFLGLNFGLAADFGSGVVSVSPAAFKPTDYQYQSLNWYAGTTEAYYSSGYPNSAFMTAPVSLPHLATITGFSAVVTDNGNGYDDEIWVSLLRHNMSTGTTDTIAFVSTTWNFISPSRQTLTEDTLTNTTVDNENYTYSIIVRFYSPNSKIKFHGAKIVYWSVL
jgi:hypothetical protein